MSIRHSNLVSVSGNTTTATISIAGEVVHTLHTVQDKYVDGLVLPAPAWWGTGG